MNYFSRTVNLILKINRNINKNKKFRELQLQLLLSKILEKNFMKLFANSFCFLCCSRKMEWTTEHGMLFCREIIAFDLCQYKPGSKETGQCLDSIAERLDSSEEPGFKVEDRLL